MTANRRRPLSMLRRALVAAVLLGSVAVVAAEPVRIGAVVSATGPASFLGDSAQTSSDHMGLSSDAFQMVEIHQGRFAAAK